jgi:long-chain acyl-CoA synthetase
MIRNYLADQPDLDFPNFKALLDHVSVAYADRTAIRMRSASGEGYDTYDFRRLGEEVRLAAAYLWKRGLRKGDAVAICAENRPEWCAAYLAVVTAGLTAVPIDSQLHEEEVLNICRSAGARAAFVSASQHGKIAALLESRELSFAVDFDGGEAGKAAGWAAVLAAREKADLPAAEDILPGDTASIIYTSGTTGLAKGVMLSHRGIIANINAAMQSLAIDEHDVFITVLPLYHTYTTTCSFLSPLAAGASITIAERLVGKSIVANIKETGATIIIAVPILYDKIRAGIEARLAALTGAKKAVVRLFQGLSRLFLKGFGLPAGKVLFRSLRRQAGLDSLRLWVSGGGPLNPATAEFYELLGFTLVQGYGMSENGPLISTNTIRYHDNRSVGVPVTDTDVKIDCPDVQGVGEILVRSPSLMKGYFGDPEASQEIMTAEGYLRTGDLGRFDRRGYLFITGRSKNLIVTGGGKNVFPEEIELRFSETRAIAEVLVLGCRLDGGNAEDVVAVCVPDEEVLGAEYGDGTPPADWIERRVRADVEAVNRTLPGYKKIVDFKIRMTPFEKTASAKIKRYLYASFDDL